MLRKLHNVMVLYVYTQSNWCNWNYTVFRRKKHPLTFSVLYQVLNKQVPVPVPVPVLGKQVQVQVQVVS